jgi:hypothetical protein
MIVCLPRVSLGIYHISQHTPVLLQTVSQWINIHDEVSNFWNAAPCSGFVKKSAIISWVGQYSTKTSPDAIRSMTKKYRILMCLVRFLLDARPCFSSSIELWLSW